MKIGIMSMQRIINYGSYMQALSLKQMVESLGHDVEFVDFKVQPPIDAKRNSVKHFFSYFFKRIRKTSFGWVMSNFFHHRPLSFRSYKSLNSFDLNFIKCYDTLGINFYKKKYRLKKDVLIIGSDEVFNCLQKNENVGFSLELFGKHNKSKRLISYAASFGDTTLDRLKWYQVDKQIGCLLKKFDCISVRDINSKNIVSSLTSINCVQHMDPVLVGNLESIKWRDNPYKNYIAVYSYSYRIRSIEGDAIMNYSRSKGLQVYSIQGEQKFCEKIPDCAPDELIPYFQNSSYIVTDTFHGILFSVICHKQFAVFVREPKDEEYSNSAKIVDLLLKLGLEDRIITVLSDLGVILEKPIDYERIEAIRRMERKRTIAYLMENIR